MASGLAVEVKINPLEQALQAREQVNNLMERYMYVSICTCSSALYHCQVILWLLCNIVYYIMLEVVGGDNFHQTELSLCGRNILSVSTQLEAFRLCRTLAALRILHRPFGFLNCIETS